jgi:ElaA protein
MDGIVWKCKPFDALNNHELYAIVRLRNEVFVVEQNCVFQDADNKDQRCFHLMGCINANLAAYARLVPPGVSYNYISIGRIITSPPFRNMGVGKALMQHAVDYCDQLFGKRTIKIGAQLYLKKFYESFGFRQTEEPYDEDGIVHIHMLKKQ